MTPILEIRDLHVGIAGAPILAGLELTIAPGETVALVGESGSGKSLTALSMLRLLPRGASVQRGSIGFEGQDVLAMGARRLNRLRGGEIAMLFQQPLAMLDPSASVGSQVAEAVRLHTNLSGGAVDRRVAELFREVGIPAPEARMGAYAHELSGGMAQRVMIAAALAGSPRLLIADEPTAALDVTAQRQILRLLARERTSRHLSTLLITHDLGVAAALADRIVVLYAGRVVEQGSSTDVLRSPKHPYTQGLIRACLLQPEPDGSLFAIPDASTREGPSATGCRFLPRCGTAARLGLQDRCADAEPGLEACGGAGQLARCWAAGPDGSRAPAPALRRPAQDARRIAVSLRQVRKDYRLGPGLTLRALDGVDLDIGEGEALGLVGESGCGKSTLARLLVTMVEPTAGELHVLGHDLQRMGAAGRRVFRRRAQLVFQDPASALDPRMRLGDALRSVLDHNWIGEPGERRAMVERALIEVGLSSAFVGRVPRECSGGELQRAVIARALLMEPTFLVCDEPTSALDGSIRAQILNLLRKRRLERPTLTLLMITHDLRVLRQVCDRVAVMYLGEIVELADTETLFSHPAHPYTQALLAASLLEEHGVDGVTGRIRGEPPSPLEPQTGCHFHARCSIADERCRAEHPPLVESWHGHAARCWQWAATLDQAARPHDCADLATVP